MRRRRFLALISGPHALMSSAPALADGSGPQLASYYDRHMALQSGVACGWVGRGMPMRMRADAMQVGVSQDAFFALQSDGRLISWKDTPDAAIHLMLSVHAVACGQSGWFAIDPFAGAVAGRRYAASATADCRRRGHGLCRRLCR